MDLLLEYLKQYGTDLLLIINEMSVYLLLGLLFAGLLKVFLPERFIVKYLRASNTRSAVNATLLGVPLPLCSCGVLPTGIALHKNGASKGATNAFLTSTPQTGLDSILVTYAMLGLPMAIIRPLVAFVSGIVSGVVTNKLTKDEAKAELEAEQTQTFVCSEEPKALGTKLLEVFRYAYLTFLSDIAKYLVWGLLAAALISVLIPNDFFSSSLVSGIWGILLILLASMPMYICATASVPIAAVLMAKGVSPGAVLVFLMAGPATNAAAFTLIGKTLGRKSLIAYLGTIITSAVGFGLLIDAFLPRVWFIPMSAVAGEHCLEPNQFVFWLKTAASLVLIALLVYIFMRKWQSEHSEQVVEKGERAFSVPDMSCNHCKKSLEGAFAPLADVQRVEADLAHKTLLIQGAISEEEIQKVIEDLGFTFGGRKH